jgi:nitroreductase
MTRKTIRRFRKDPIPDLEVEAIMEACVSAPSAGNSQDWEFVMVRTPEGRKRLAQAAMGQRQIEQAPLSIVACANSKKNRYGMRGASLFSIQDVAAAVENILLAAWAKGIGSCWIGAFNEAEVSAALSLPGHVRPQAIITLGYPAEDVAKPKRWPPKDVLHAERF